MKTHTSNPVAKMFWKFALMILCLLGLPAVTHAERKGFQLNTFRDPSLLIQDVTQLRSLGADIVRFPVYIYDVPLDYWLSKIDAILPTCDRLGVVLVIALHPGSQAQFRNVESDVHFADWWGVIAGRYRNSQRLWYDLANEPKDPNWRAIALVAARRIRAVDWNNHIVFAARGTTTSSAGSFEPLPGITRQIVSFHFYNWWSDIQGVSATGSYPNAANGHTGAALRQLMLQVQANGLKYGTEVYIGEVAVRHDHPNAGRFLRDFTDLCDELGIHLTVHAFREAEVWNYETNPNTWLALTSWLGRR